MKLGVSYIVFDGVELLEHSIRQIRQHVEYVSVIYQKVSWFGKILPTEDFNVLKNLLKTGQINELIEFTSFLPLNSKERSAIPTAKRYETAKRQVGLNLCLRNRCTHYLCMDVDEFYDSSQFSKAKEQIIKYNYDVTAVRFINYVNIPTLHRGYDSNRVPFICKISSSSKMSNKFFVKCDPTRGISGNTTKSHEFSSTDLTMHHMETVRKNLLLKYESTTRGIMDRNRTRELVKIIGEITEHCTTFNFKKIIFPKAGNGNLTKCENIFNIPYTQWKK